MADIEIILCALMVFSLLIILFRQSIIKEHLTTYVPIELVFKSTIMIDTNEQYTDVFLKDLITNNFEIYLLPRHPSKKYMMQKCITQECDEINRIDYKITNHHTEPLVTNNEIERGKMIKIIEGFTSQHIFFTARAKTQVPLGAPILLEDIAKTIRSERLVVSVDETPETRRLFDLYACIWHDDKKSTTCEYIKWEPGINPEIDMGRAYQMIRIIPKTKVK